MPSIDLTNVSVISNSNPYLQVINAESATEEELIIRSFTADPLVISCALHRLTHQKPEEYTGNFIAYSHDNLINEITEEDEWKAEEIKSDFRKKLSYLALTDGKMSLFKRSLSYFLETDFRDQHGKYKIPDKLLGMVARLPAFYEYNMEQHDICWNEEGDNQENENDQLSGKLSLTFIKTLDPRRKKVRGKIEYWFKDNNNNKIMLSLDKTNHLLPLFDVFVNAGPVSLSGTFRKRRNYATSYYVADSNWSIG